MPVEGGEPLVRGIEAQSLRHALEPPPPPSACVVFKVMLRKHFLVAKKRKRVLTSAWPAILYSVICVIFFHVLEGSAEDDQTKKVLALVLAILVPLYLTIAVQAVLQCGIVEIVSEKESKMKVVQEIYGLTSSMYWLSWGAYFLVISALCMALIYGLLTLAAPIFASSSSWLVLLLLAIAYVQQFEFAAIIAVFFDKQQTASSVASFVSLGLMVLAAVLQAGVRGPQSELMWLVGLLPTVNVYNGFSSILWQEALFYCYEGVCTQGLRPRSLWADELCLVEYSASEPCVDELTEKITPAGQSLALMLVAVVLYAMLAWWLEQVWQGEYGRAKPLCFCLDSAYMCPRRRGRVADRDGAAQDPEAARPALLIEGMRKVFKGGKVAVDEMNLEVASGEIFALLGHNGAGKTTCINCVVGLMPMTSGEVVVNGFDVTTDLDAARRQMSICPQDNPLYDVFTVKQHLTFFASLRGVSQESVEARIGEVLRALGMAEKESDLCTSLSGGQKRRLWVATALLGERPLVFLDEPTSGMDPSSRRELWQLLLQMKESGRSVLFTTHYLEEADVLADRKAVLARGKVQACGTSRDLKIKFGLGYHLQVQFHPGAPNEEEVEQLTALVHQYVAGATVKERERQTASLGGLAEMTSVSASSSSVVRAVAAPVCFTLPFQEVSKFGPLLLDLDSKKEALRIQGYSVSMTSLEDVFMSLGKQAERETGEGSNNEDLLEIDPEPEEGPQRSERRSARAMLRLRLRLLFGNRRAIYSAVILPAIFNIIALLNAPRQSGAEGGIQTQNNWTLALYSPMAFGISIIAFTVQLIQDKEWKCKYVALAQGLSVKSYWAGTFVAHYAVSLLNSLILVVAVHLLEMPVLSEQGYPLLMAQALVYPVGLLLMAYNISLFFTKVEVAVKVLPLMNMAFASIPPVCVSVFMQLGGDWPFRGHVLHAVMCIINPFYGLPGMIVVMLSGSEAEKSTAALLTSWSALPLYGSVVCCLLFGTHLIWQDARSYSARPGSYQAFGGERKDEDVLQEEIRISHERDCSHEAARYQDLHHTYRTKVHKTWKETHAVRGISLGIQPGECFGLLGPNGAGKTTTLAVLTGEVRPPTRGQVHIRGQDVTTAEGLAQAYSELGVCPQVDPLWETITGREHLLFYGRIKGVPEASLGSTADALLRRLGLDRSDAMKASSTYSGGMKRKLSLAIALIGRSPLLFLDEPSAAVDAGAKRHLWKVIRLRGQQQTVVLTTHSMEEAEALCDRIAVQVCGQLRCLGTPMRIKEKYGSGYQLELFCNAPGGNRSSLSSASSQIPEEQCEKLKRFVQSTLSDRAELLEHHAGRFLFQLPPAGEAAAIASRKRSAAPAEETRADALRQKTEQGSLTLGKIFSEVEANKEEQRIWDYSLTQPSLEQVFIRFAREQEDEVASQDVAGAVAPQAAALSSLAPTAMQLSVVSGTSSSRQ